MAESDNDLAMADWMKWTFPDLPKYVPGYMSHFLVDFKKFFENHSSFAVNEKIRFFRLAAKDAGVTAWVLGITSQFMVTWTWELFVVAVENAWELKPVAPRMASDMIKLKVYQEVTPISYQGQIFTDYPCQMRSGSVPHGSGECCRCGKMGHVAVFCDTPWRLEPMECGYRLLFIYSALLAPAGTGAIENDGPEVEGQPAPAAAPYAAKEGNEEIEQHGVSPSGEEHIIAGPIPADVAGNREHGESKQSFEAMTPEFYSMVPLDDDEAGDRSVDGTPRAQETRDRSEQLDGTPAGEHVGIGYYLADGVVERDGMDKLPKVPAAASPELYSTASLVAEANKEDQLPELHESATLEMYSMVPLDEDEIAEAIDIGAADVLEDPAGPSAGRFDIRPFLHLSAGAAIEAIFARRR